jgi:hypothetical protein
VKQKHSKPQRGENKRYENKDVGKERRENNDVKKKKTKMRKQKRWENKKQLFFQKN